LNALVTTNIRLRLYHRPTLLLDCFVPCVAQKKLARELPCPTALGAPRSSLGEDRASCFHVGTCPRRGHSGSRLRRRFPFTGSSECHTPTRWDGHSATTDGARFLFRLSTVTVRDVMSIALPDSTVWVLNVRMNAQPNYAALYPLPTPSLCSDVEEGGLAPQIS